MRASYVASSVCSPHRATFDTAHAGTRAHAHFRWPVLAPVTLPGIRSFVVCGPLHGPGSQVTPTLPVGALRSPCDDGILDGVPSPSPVSMRCLCPTVGPATNDAGRVRRGNGGGIGGSLAGPFSRLPSHISAQEFLQTTQRRVDYDGASSRRDCDDEKTPRLVARRVLRVRDGSGSSGTSDCVNRVQRSLDFAGRFNRLTRR